ncbi:3-phosphoserine/phosphohydroxythreonine transaminase [Gammaproteobacteria bacterium]|jgi:phosphoserine aminotransferase|nr:3-phosphoserine/phosphohydroxythreonine transaminase [Gammaproteobacteria bacterium]MDC1013926.1 3-phosphoserine/phosphohydroxythreonine transaminase [Gammaproteobacteria bacterium]
MRKWNFSAGPAAIPEVVLKEAQAEMLEWKGSGMSVMEMSHRSSDYIDVANTARQDLIDLLNIPSDYQVLFLQGGATLQFSMLPMNFGFKGIADYVLSGSWSKKAINEASKITNINIVASSESSNFDHVPNEETWKCSENSAYLHYVANETIQGNALHAPPSTKAPLIADMSSVILSEPIDVSRFSMIYAGAQKNIGPAGLTICIIKNDFLKDASTDLPGMLQYAKHADAESMFNTPPTFAWYLSGKVFTWLKGQGGLESIGEINNLKAQRLYDFIDESDLYSNPVFEENRSIMNIPFLLADPELDAEFLHDAENAGLLNLKGHRSVGGMRASIYNAVPIEAVDALINFMGDFQSKHG